MLLSDLALHSLLVDFSTTEPFAALVVGVHVDASANLASWNSAGRQRARNSIPGELVDWAANSVLWFTWSDRDSPGVVMPGVVVEAIPFLVLVFVDVSTVVPVAFVPTPSVASEAALDDAPVVPSAAVPFVPGFLVRNPSPHVAPVSVVPLTPVANLWMVPVPSDKMIARRFFALVCFHLVQDTSVLIIDLSL